MDAINPIEPTVSVIMAVKNGGKEVSRAIESILSQTFTDFEFIIINDGSTDDTLKILEGYRDPRIHIYSQENQGLARSLNRGLSLAVGAYIARQDHDDISLPLRLQKQVEYLKAHPDCGLLGTAAEIWGENGPQNRFHRHPTDAAILAFDLIFNNPFVHTSWMFPNKVISNVGYYTIDPDREPPEDYEYVSRINRLYSVANLAEPLVIYREFPNSLSSQLRPTSRNQKKSFSSKLATISAENLAFHNAISPIDPRVIFFGRLTHSYLQDNSYCIHYVKLCKMISKAVQSIEGQYQVKIPTSVVKNKLDTMFYQYLNSPYIPFLYKALAFTSWEGVCKSATHFLKRLLNLFHKINYSVKCRIWWLGSKVKDVFRFFGLLPPRR